MTMDQLTAGSALVRALANVARTAMQDSVPAIITAMVTSVDEYGRVKIMRLGSAVEEPRYYSVLASYQYPVVDDTVLCARFKSNLIVLGAVASINIKRATQTDLLDKTSGVNLAGKYEGKQVWDLTNHRVVFAAGATDVSVWKDGVNSTVYTPI